MESKPSPGKDYNLSTDHFRNWLEKYRQAWVEASPDLAAGLFSSNAFYYETPFGPVFRGRKEIAAYWQEVPDNQENIFFTFDILAVRGNFGYCRWKASFTRRNTGSGVVLDGIFEVRFDHNGLCDVFLEWWHRDEAVK